MDNKLCFKKQRFLGVENEIRIYRKNISTFNSNDFAIIFRSFDIVLFMLNDPTDMK